MNETLQNICIVGGCILLLCLFIYGRNFFPPIVCEREGGEWDNWTVQCVKKGETTWDNFYSNEENECEEVCDCLKTCESG